MTIHETEAKSLLLRRRRVDAWFVSASGMNLYRGCAHDCAYCDGRAERYHVAGEFGRDVVVKTNAIEVLRRELRARRRRPTPRSYVLLGGGVGDSYQPVEGQYGLARQVLGVLLEAGLPVHVLTKSSLVERDLDLLCALHARAGVILSMSLSSARDDLGARFEPGCARPSRRLETLRRAKQRGLPTGVYLMPVIPSLSDGADVVDETMARCAESGVDFVVCGGMTLKVGRQREHFLGVLAAHAPDLVPEVARHYGDDRWGMPDDRYYGPLAQRFVEAARRHHLPGRVPPRLYAALLDENERDRKSVV
jgi:DNA repair photolyase